MPLKLTEAYRISKSTSSKAHCSTKKLKSILQAPTSTKAITPRKTANALSLNQPTQTVGYREIFRTFKSGNIPALPTDLASAISLLLESQFEPIPLTAWFSRDEIAKLHQIRSGLPSVVPISLLHAFLEQPTRVERELQHLITNGVLRIVKVSNRGKALSECVVLMDTLKTILRKSFKEADPKIAERFIGGLLERPGGNFPLDYFAEEDKAELISHGYLTLETQITSIPALPGAFNNVLEASTSLVMAPELRLSLPSFGNLLRLYSGARDRLYELVPSNKIIPWERVLNRWNSERGRELSRIKKWKEFCGLKLEVIVGIAVGEGSLEVVRVCGGSGVGLKGRWKNSSTISRWYA